MPVLDRLQCSELFTDIFQYLPKPGVTLGDIFLPVLTCTSYRGSQQYDWANNPSGGGLWSQDIYHLPGSATEGFRLGMMDKFWCANSVYNAEMILSYVSLEDMFSQAASTLAWAVAQFSPAPGVV